MFVIVAGLVFVQDSETFLVKGDEIWPPHPTKY